MSDSGRAALLATIAAETRRAVSAEATALSDALRAKHGETVRATLFYGSCLRPPTPDALAAEATAHLQAYTGAQVRRLRVELCSAPTNEQ